MELSKSTMKSVHIINGPNLNLLGKREPAIYGSVSFESFIKELRDANKDITLAYFQSNGEGRIIDYLHEVGSFSNGIILNPAAYTHTSIAIADALQTIECPVVEVHISNVYAREGFRHKSHIAPFCQGTLIGLGLYGYEAALGYIRSLWGEN